jgi:UDP-perosamine 4-acetyltransferase
VVGGVPITGLDEDILKMSVDAVELVNGLGNRASRTDSGLSGRRTLFGRFAALGYRFPVISHVSAAIASDAMLGDGAQVMAGVVIQPAARIGRNVLVKRAQWRSMTASWAITHMLPGRCRAAACPLARASIGAGAVVQGVSVERALPLAGAVVAKNVGAGASAAPDWFVMKEIFVVAKIRPDRDAAADRSRPRQIVRSNVTAGSSAPSPMCAALLGGVGPMPVDPVMNRTRSRRAGLSTRLRQLMRKHSITSFRSSMLRAGWSRSLTTILRSRSNPTTGWSRYRRPGLG